MKGQRKGGGENVKRGAEGKGQKGRECGVG